MNQKYKIILQVLNEKTTLLGDIYDYNKKGGQIVF